MGGLIEAISGIVRELLPTKESPIGEWITKTSVLLMAMFGVGAIGYWTVADTQWAADRGLKKLTPTPAQTVIDQVQRRRKIFAEMGKVFNIDPNVYAILVVNAYDPTNEQYNFKDVKQNSKLLIRFSRLREDVDYYAFNTLETTFELRMKEADSLPLTRCQWGAITPTDKYLLTQTLGKTFDSDWFGVCPIFYKTFPTSASIVFYKKAEKINPYDDSDQLFRLRFEAFNQEVQRIIYAPPNSFAATVPETRTRTIPQNGALAAPVGF
jgi:hypothetical protein